MRERAIAEPLSPSLSGDSITLEFIGLLWLSLTFGSTSCRSVDLMAYLSIKVLPETTLVNQCFFFSVLLSLSLFACRQLEAVVRIAESLAKMKLQAIAGEEEVDEALRLFQVSTLDAALSGSLSGMSM